MSFQILTKKSLDLTKNLFYKLNARSAIQLRNLNLQEYQSKDLMRQNGVTVQKFVAVHNLDDVNQILDNKNSELFNCKEYVIKAQVLAGGRGKGMKRIAFLICFILFCHLEVFLTNFLLYFLINF